MSRYKEVGKGDSQRFAQVPEETVRSNWDRIFGTEDERKEKIGQAERINIRITRTVRSVREQG